MAGTSDSAVLVTRLAVTRKNAALVEILIGNLAEVLSFRNVLYGSCRKTEHNSTLPSRCYSQSSPSLLSRPNWYWREIDP